MWIRERKKRANVGHSDIPCVKRTKRLTNNRKKYQCFLEGGTKGAGRDENEREEKKNGKNKARNETEDGNGNGKTRAKREGGGILESGKEERGYIQRERD